MDTMEWLLEHTEYMKMYKCEVDELYYIEYVPKKGEFSYQSNKTLDGVNYDVIREMMGV